MSIELTSPAFEQGGSIPPTYARSGDDVSPPLRWTGVPAGTAELALVVEDPDAPRGTFRHWIVTGLDPSLDHLEAGTLPEGASEGRNEVGDVGYGGPQPPEGEQHRYVFQLLALEDNVMLAPGYDYPAFHDAAQGKEVGRGELVARYP